MPRMSSSIEGLLEEYKSNGFVVFPGFASEDEVEAMNTDCHRFIEENVDESKRQYTVYDAKSIDKHYVFYNQLALNENGLLKCSKHHGVQNYGNGLTFYPSFRDVLFSSETKQILRSLNYVKPVTVTSQIVCKYPGMPMEIVPHQDGAYHVTKPPGTLIAFWLALTDVTETNGCVWFAKGSHMKYPLEDQSDCETAVKFKFEYDIEESLYVPVPVKKGDLVLMDGAVVHKSSDNRSDSPRRAFLFHVFDSHKSTLNETNHYQECDRKSFY